MTGPAIKEYVTDWVSVMEMQTRLNEWLGKGYMLHSTVNLDDVQDKMGDEMVILVLFRL